MGPNPSESESQMTRDNGFAVIGQLGSELSFVGFFSDQSNAEDRAENEALKSDHNFFVVSAIKYGK